MPHAGFDTIVAGFEALRRATLSERAEAAETK